MRGLTEKQRRVLAELGRSTEMLAPDLARALGLDFRAVHQHLDALEKKGVVSSAVTRGPRWRRRGCDGRIARVGRVARITPEGIIALAVQP